MKRIIILLLSAFTLQLTAFAQGPLTPPGAPAPTMKTLAQIEPRTAITNTGSVTISNSGSYYLTANISVSAANSNGVIITTGNVTLDLNGFTIISTAANYSGFGIRLSGSPRNITILNGHIAGGTTYSNGVYSGGGFVYGIAHDYNDPANTRVSGVSISGCLQGIWFNTSESTLVESCTVENIADRGIVASSVSHCSAFRCGNDAITGLTVSDCYGYATGPGDGIHANAANNCYGTSIGSGDGVYADTANNCYGQASDGHGVYANIANGCEGVGPNLGPNHGGILTKSANHCHGTGYVGIECGKGGAVVDCIGVNSFYGIRTGEGSLVNGCVVSSNGIGMYVYTGTLVQNCAAYGNDYDGIATDYAGCTIAGCAAYNNGENGIYVLRNCRVIGNNCYQNGGCGISAGTPGNGAAVGYLNHIEGNTVAQNTTSGIRCTGANNMVFRNLASGNHSPTINFDLATGNRVGAIISPPQSAAISGNSGGSGLGTTDPYANFSY